MATIQETLPKLTTAAAAPAHILSTNKKTKYSLNFPREGHCQPTAICWQSCYGKTGPINWSNSRRKKTYVSQYLLGNDIGTLLEECRSELAVRLAGTGDLLQGHLPNLFKLAELAPDTQFWGMTRKLDIASRINGVLPNLKLLVSVDASSSEDYWAYDGRLCFGPRRAGDAVPDDSRIVTVFPYHFIGRIVGQVPAHKKDCPAVRHTIKSCSECGRCWKW